MRQALALLRCGALPMLGLLTSMAMSVACSSKSASNPTAVSIDELKYPGDLIIFDKGDGKVTLQWTASNNESDFYGFNVYGMKDPTPPAAGTLAHATFTSGGITPTEGQAFSLLDEQNKPSADAKGVLAKFDYEPTDATPLEAAGTSPTQAVSTNDASSDASTTTPVFSARPIATVDGAGKGIYPTCQVAATGNACVMTTAAGAANTNVANGVISFDLTTASTTNVSTTLNVGENYCFFVLSTMAKAAQVSATTSNFQCITPSYFTSFQVTLPVPGGATNQRFDVAQWVKSCSPAKGCPDPTATSDSVQSQAATPSSIKLFDVDGVSSHTPTASTTYLPAVYIETFNNTYPSFNAGSNSGVQDVGYYAGGLTDPKLPQSAPAIAISTPFASGGYSLPGQSLSMQAGHVYVAAVADGTTGKFFYVWIYVKSSTPIVLQQSGDTAQTVEFDVKSSASSI